MKSHVYDEYALVEEDHWWHVGRKEIFDRVIKKYIKPERTWQILSVGCGTGAELTYLSNFGRVTGVDNSQKALKYASKIQNVEVQLGSLPNLPFKDESFDFIVCSEVLEHIEKDDEALTDMKRVLKPGGYMLITVPAYSWLWSDHDKEAQHARRYYKRNLEKKIKNSGFSLKKSSYINFFLFPPLVFVTLSSKIFRFSRAKITFSTPTKPINKILKKIFSFEGKLIKYVPFPFGGSILIVANKAKSPRRNTKRP